MLHIESAFVGIERGGHVRVFYFHRWKRLRLLRLPGFHGYGSIAEPIKKFLHERTLFDFSAFDFSAHLLVMGVMPRLYVCQALFPFVFGVGLLLYRLGAALPVEYISEIATRTGELSNVLPGILGTCLV
jgi:hypothetical protein